MESILQYLGYFFVTLGAIFLFLGSLGIFRMPDIYTRLQAGTKASTLGTMSLLFGVGLLQPEWLPKLLLMIIFIMISNPISSHAIARGSHKSGVKPLLKVDLDAYEQDLKKETIQKEENK